MRSHPTIVIENGVSKLDADQPIVNAVRPLVAYREAVMPPVQVQRIVRQFMFGKPRMGCERELEALYRSHGAELVQLGFPREKLDTSMYERTLRTKGLWDGWQTLVSSNGVFPTGLVQNVVRALKLHIGAHQVDLIDNRRAPARAAMRIGQRPPLYPFQEEAIRAWLAAGGRGVINLPPRSGKTRIAVAAVHDLGLPTLLVTPSIALVEQAVAAFREFMPHDQVIGVTGGAPAAKGQRALNRALVWVTTPQTAAGPRARNGRERAGVGQGMPGIESRCVLIIDEFHHSAAQTWHTISQSARNAYYRIGLTGTHYRADGRDLAMHAILERCVYRRTVGEMIGLGRLVPARVAMVRIPEELGVDTTGERLYRAGIVGFEPRNTILAWAAHYLAHAGKRVLVIVKEVAHAADLASRIPGAHAVDGTDSSRVRPLLKALEAGVVKCVVGTSVIGEGVDVPAADALVYAAGGKSRVKVVQDFFRVLTASEGKHQGIVIDCADNHHERLIESAAYRLSAYREEFDSEVVGHDSLPEWLAQAVAGPKGI